MQGNFDLTLTDMPLCKKGDVVHNMSDGEKIVVRRVCEDPSFLMWGKTISWVILQYRASKIKILHVVRKFKNAF